MTMMISISALWKMMNDKFENGFFAHLMSLSRIADGRALITAEVGYDGESERVEFILLEELIFSINLSCGCLSDSILRSCEILQEDLEILDFYATVSRAYISACSSFAYSPSSYKGLYRKLVQKGFSRAVAEEAVELVRERGFLDERAIAMRRAEVLTQKLWGRSRIIAKLREEGFEHEGMYVASEYLSGVDFAESCALAITKKYGEIPCDRREREKLFAALMRLGYSSTDIKKAMDLLDKE